MLQTVKALFSISRSSMCT